MMCKIWRWSVKQLWRYLRFVLYFCTCNGLYTKHFLSLRCRYCVYPEQLANQNSLLSGFTCTLFGYNTINRLIYLPFNGLPLSKSFASVRKRTIKLISGYKHISSWSQHKNLISLKSEKYFHAINENYTR